MTSPDDDLSRLLRRELHAEAARFTFAQDGLSQIRERLRSRSLSPCGAASVWMRSGTATGFVTSLQRRWPGFLVKPGGAGRIRRGHSETTWPLPRSGRPRSRGVRRSGTRGRRRFPYPGAYDRFGTAWLRPVLAVAAVFLFAGTAMAVPGVRHAIVNIGSSSSGGGTSATGAGGTNGTGGTSGNGDSGTGGPADRQRPQIPGGQGNGTGSKGNVAATSPCRAPAPRAHGRQDTVEGRGHPQPGGRDPADPGGRRRRCRSRRRPRVGDADHSAGDAHADLLGSPETDR